MNEQWKKVKPTNHMFFVDKDCRIEFVDGELVCLKRHRNYDNCDLVKAEKRRDEQAAKELGITLEEYYGGGR